MTRSIQLRSIKRAVGGKHRTKERLSQESLNSRTREYMPAKSVGQLFFVGVCVSVGGVDGLGQDYDLSGIMAAFPPL